MPADGTLAACPTPGLRHVPLQRQYSSLADFVAVRNTGRRRSWVKTGSALVEHKISASPPKPDIRALRLRLKLLNDSLLGPPQRPLNEQRTITIVSSVSHCRGGRACGARSSGVRCHCISVNLD